MTPTTHVATSCLITVLTVQSGMDGLQKLLVVTGGSLFAHLIFDIVPHGLITTPNTIFKKIIPTVVELFPGPLILIVTIWLFGNPFLFLVASFFGLIPDLSTVLYCRKKEVALKIPFVSFIHQIHRKIHWFETEHSDGTVSYLFPKNPLLTLEAFLTVFILMVLFRQNIS
jgi:hypothetical protein